MTQKVRFGHQTLNFPGPELGELRASNDLLNDAIALKARLTEDGYLLLRELIDPETVRVARETILHYMDEQGVLVPGKPILEGAMPQDGRGVRLMGRDGISHTPQVLGVLESPRLFNLYEGLFDEPPLTFKYKWLRGVGNEQYTSAHYDIVYMGRGSKELITTWIPFGDTSVEHGTLAICVGSHNAPEFARLRETYGKLDVDRDRTEGWFTKEPMEIVEKFGGYWATTNFKMGDILLFGMYTMHASTTNLTTRFRLSADVRYQPATAPVDERWYGEEMTGHTVFGQKPLRSMEEARAAWGV